MPCSFIDRCFIGMSDKCENLSAISEKSKVFKYCVICSHILVLLRTGCVTITELFNLSGLFSYQCDEFNNTCFPDFLW